jgi:hypothetical protein
MTNVKCPMTKWLDGRLIGHWELGIGHSHSRAARVAHRLADYRLANSLRLNVCRWLHNLRLHYLWLNNRGGRRLLHYGGRLIHRRRGVGRWSVGGTKRTGFEAATAARATKQEKSGE